MVVDTLVQTFPEWLSERNIWGDEADFRYDISCNILSLINNKESPIGAELGTQFGGLSYMLLKNCPRLKLHSIDLWDYPDEDHEYEKVEWDFESNYNCAVDLLSEFGDRSIINVGTTWDIINGFEDEYFDFIYIDASHDYESVRRDILSSIPKIKPDGWLCGHDYHPNQPGVVKAVDSVVNNKLINLYTHTAWSCSIQDI